MLVACGAGTPWVARVAMGCCLPTSYQLLVFILLLFASRMANRQNEMLCPRVCRYIVFNMASSTVQEHLQVACRGWTTSVSEVNAARFVENHTETSKDIFRDCKGE